MSAWLLTCNQDVFDLEAFRRDGHDLDSWSVGRYRDRLADGDRFVMWLTGPRGGLIGRGRFTGTPTQQPSAPDVYWLEDPGTRWYVPLTVEEWLAEPVPRRHFTEDPRFAEKSPLRTLFAANPHKLTEEQWDAFAECFDRQDSGERTASRAPQNPPPEVLEAEQGAAKAAGRRSSRRSGQGFLLTAAERRAVELHSVQLATEHFRAEGWSVEDVGARESYDLLLSRGEERLYVEVKGTVSEGAQVVLTRSEVERQRELAPHNALVVVHSIVLDRTAEPPKADGGVLHCVSPWKIAEEDLTVVSYIYRTGL